MTEGTQQKQNFWVWVSAALLLAVLGGAAAVHAERDPLAGPADGRMRTVVYNPRDVVRVVGHYGFTTMIQFADYEAVENISIGDSMAWQVVKNPRGNMVWVKPIEEDAETNLTVVTRATAVAGGPEEQRIYIFSLEAERAEKHTSDAFTWHVRFHYPQDEEARLAEGARWQTLSDSALASSGDGPAVGPARWNFQYTFAGDKSQVPLRIFDNGRFTYLEFADAIDTPAIFLVDDERNEALVNTVRDGKYIVIHRVGRQFTLRNGSDVTCIFNESFEGAAPLDQGSPVERSELGGRKGAKRGQEAGR